MLISPSLNMHCLEGANISRYIHSIYLVGRGMGHHDTRCCDTEVEGHESVDEVGHIRKILLLISERT
jgi:hypothetical protein